MFLILLSDRRPLSFQFAWRSIHWFIHWLNVVHWNICNHLFDTKSTLVITRVWRYQRGNQNPQIEKEQTTQWLKEKGQKDKQQSIKHTHKIKDRVTRTPLKTGSELKCSGRVGKSCSKSGTRRVYFLLLCCSYWSMFSFLCSVLSTVVCLLVLFLLVIVFSDLELMASLINPCGIFQTFLTRDKDIFRQWYDMDTKQRG